MVDVQLQSRGHRVVNRAEWLTHYAMEFCLLALVAFLFITAPGFATIPNLLNVLRTVSMLGIVAFGMTAVIISGEIDLSVGAMIALSGCLSAWVVGATSGLLGDIPSVILAAVAAVLTGLFSGVFTGVMRTWFNVPTFITTLGLFTALRGIANLITGGFPLATFPSWYDFFGNGSWFGVPFPAFVLLLVFAIMYFLMEYTSFGRAIYAVGGNAEAARLSGIRVGLVKTSALAITGGLAAISGLLIASQIGSGTGTTATGMELDVIAATIVGGASLFGGKGRMSGTLVGVLFLGFTGNGMTLLNVSEYWQFVVRGALILAAVLINQVLDRRK